MCGILAISSSKNGQFDLNPAIQAIHHRGPDDDGIFISQDGDAHLGQVRLSIIDLSAAGHQPMQDSSARFVMTYNGEVYNFLELKAYLESTYGLIAWKSSSDTEVILEGFVREGYSFLSKLNGIFALAIYDQEARELHVLRDPIGIKPLYFSVQGDAVFFSSEVKGLLAFQHLKRTVRKQSLVEQLAFMYVPEPYTMYEEFKKVPPGIYQRYQEGKLVDSKSLFEHLHTPISTKSEEVLTEQLHATLEKAVRRQLIADVPISLFLSGGLDSSSIAVESVKAKANIHSAYTISFSKEDNSLDGQSSDLHYASLMAKKLGLNLHIIQAESEFLSLLPTLLDFMEDGISDPAAINTFLICQSARKDGVKVMLSGQGADEYLAGYRRYQAEKMILGMSTLTKSTLASLGRVLPSTISGRFSTTYRRFKKIAKAAGQHSNERIASYFMWGEGEQIKSLFVDQQMNQPGLDLVDFLDQHTHLDTFSSMLLADQQFDLRSLNLSYTDKMSMAVGLEVRVPFLDFEMVQLMNSVPRELMLKNGQQKYILKKAMEPYLPKEVIYREKAGFALPIRSWFSKRSAIIDHYFDQPRLESQGIFRPQLIQQLLDEQFSGKEDHSYLLFSMLCQQIWLDKQAI
ncbi:asparagine synthase (glutamine-hydrolyzing) [Cytophagaceae bacterium 50C-KIRBA]|uniref:asparagine synthase (glutamine-hydrolyzing) n=1 Tax=Aquirufa beregesia TaxID=2516556 RepID=A0ABX0F1S3_9BACT|nr:asparagine synthase (glutamine-hydrolyzing) [Aquirufa beregesia]NGZ43800.1 asparagine synthase (glutamine-hydrolyzing) [Aquirufa beregesia]